jgi:uncharacterized BrkB/YihY/UPF0761 family membrane protein
MTYIKKIAGINLGILLLYTLFAGFGSRGQSHAQLGVLMLMAFAVSVHVAVCLLAMIYMFVNKKRDEGRAWLLTAGLVLVIGFSACYGAASL